MAKISKNIVDAALRDCVFTDLYEGKSEQMTNTYVKINDRQYGTIIVDANGVERYVRVGVIVAEERETETARELMQKEIDAYIKKQNDKAEKAAKAAEKAARDKARREAKKAEQEG